MSDHKIIKHLDWDSDFFGINIGVVENFNLDKIGLSYLKFEMNSNGNDCVYVKTKVDTKSIVQANYDVQPIITQVTYECDLLNWHPTNLANEKVTKETPKEDLDRIYNLSIELSNASRFWLDEKFRPKIAEMYIVWIKNIISDNAASIFIARDRRGNISGFVTCKEKNEIGYLDLIVVSTDHQGQGIGKVLMEMFMNHIYENKISKAIVTTQLSNVPAKRLYENFGFKLSGATNVFHVWK